MTGPASGTEHLSVRLPDGRNLAYAEYGDPAGTPVLYFHGTPGSRLLARPAHGPAARLGVRLVAPDRPGMGASDHQPARRIIDWPADVAALADAIGADRFGVVAVSGGAPYALACGWGLPERVGAVAVVSGGPPADSAVVDDLPPAQRRLLRLTRLAPWTARPFVAGIAAVIRRNPARARAQLLARSSAPDRAVLADDEHWRAVNDAVVECFRTGTRGMALEVRRAVEPWGFPLADVGTEIDLWHGELDGQTNVVAARWLAEQLPRCRLTVVEGAGHLWYLEHMDEVLAHLVSRER